MEPLPDHVVPRRVVIVGGGFAGLFAARWPKRAPVEVTLVDRSANHVFQPLLYQCERHRSPARLPGPGVRERGDGERALSRAAERSRVETGPSRSNRSGT